MKKVLIILLVLVLLAGLGMLLFRHFVTNRIPDVGGMENPDYSESALNSDAEQNTLTYKISQEDNHGTV